MKLALPLLVPLLFAGCVSNSPRQNQSPAATAPAPDTLAGNWTGTWQSVAGHGNGPLTASIIPIPPPATGAAADTQYFQATFTATYGKAITSEYTVIFAAYSAADRYQKAKAQLEEMKKQAAQGNLELSPEAQQYVEYDPELRTLAQTKRQLDAQLAELRDEHNEDSRWTEDVKTRLAIVDKQLVDRRQKIESTVRVNMLQQAQQNCDTSSALAEYGLMFTGDKDLGLPSGGIYHYRGTVQANDFYAGYQSSADNGTFTLKRAP